jgi:hypothetical protein
MCFDISRHLCHNKDDRQHFREAPKGSKVTCIIFARHSYHKGDTQQKRITFVRVTIGRFLPLHSWPKRNRTQGLLRPELLPPPAIVADELSSPWHPLLRPSSTRARPRNRSPTSPRISTARSRPPRPAGLPPPLPFNIAGAVASWRAHLRPPQPRPSPPIGRD